MWKCVSNHKFLLFLWLTNIQNFYIIHTRDIRFYCIFRSLSKW